MDNKYAGMTVNERLYVSGLTIEFDNAVARKDADGVRRILESVELTEENIVPILEQLQLRS